MKFEEENLSTIHVARSSNKRRWGKVTKWDHLLQSYYIEVHISEQQFSEWSQLRGDWKVKVRSRHEVFSPQNYWENNLKENGLFQLVASKPPCACAESHDSVIVDSRVRLSTSWEIGSKKREAGRREQGQHIPSGPDFSARSHFLKCL